MFLLIDLGKPSQQPKQAFHPHRCSCQAFYPCKGLRMAAWTVANFDFSTSFILRLGNSSFTAKSPAIYRFPWYVIAIDPKTTIPDALEIGQRHGSFVAIANQWVHDQKISLQLSNAVSGICLLQNRDIFTSLPSWLDTCPVFAFPAVWRNNWWVSCPMSLPNASSGQMAKFQFHKCQDIWGGSKKPSHFRCEIVQGLLCRFAKITPKILTVCIWTISPLTGSQWNQCHPACSPFEYKMSNNRFGLFTSTNWPIKSLASKPLNPWVSTRCLCALPGKKFQSGYNIPLSANAAPDAMGFFMGREMPSSIIAVGNGSYESWTSPSIL